MERVFLGGSRRVSRLNADIRQRLDGIVGRGLAVLVGDANGADRAIQQYLSEKDYRDVEVFCAGARCRNNVGGWPTRRIDAGRKRGYDLYAMKDREMAAEADYGFMLWDGESRGTLANALRLLERDKWVLVYNSPRRSFVELKDIADWSALAEDAPEDVRVKLARETKTRHRSDPAFGHTVETQAKLI